MNLRSIYTPQLVVNGTYELVGSNGSEARARIEKALHEPAVIALTIANVEQRDNEIVVSYHLDKPTTDRINIALVNKAVENYVPRGENTGRTLSHANVVVYFQQQEALENGSVRIPRQEGSKQRVVLFLSDGKGKVTGAASANLLN